jgi:hypothetical protein
MAKLPVWEIWLAIVFAIGCGLWITNQIAIWRELHQKRLTKLSDIELEDTVRKWLDNPGRAVTRLPDNEKAHFAFLVEYTDNKTKIVVSRLKSDREKQYIAIQGSITVASTKEAELSESQLEKISRRIGLETARANVYFTVVPFPSGRNIRVFSWVPLYDELNASFFNDECLNVTKGIVLARYIFATSLEEMGKTIQQISHEEGVRNDSPKT